MKERYQIKVFNTIYIAIKKGDRIKVVEVIKLDE